MSKAARTRQQSARARIAAERAAARRAQVRNRVLLTGGSILVVIAIVVTFVVIKSGRSTPSAAAGCTRWYRAARQRVTAGDQRPGQHAQRGGRRLGHFL